jgi:enoyl-CoA hydratase
MLHWSGMFSHLLFEADDKGVALVTVNRPDKLNALSGAVVVELQQAIDRIAGDNAIRAAILTGAGEKAFVAGADINELAVLSPVQARERAIRAQRTLRLLETCGKPSVAAVNGYALGGGLELAMGCTVRFASENARLGQPEVKLGIIPGYGGTQRLPRLVGRGRAMEMLLAGDPITAAEAHRIGLVNAVVPQAELLGYCRAWLDKVLANGPLALQLAMEAVDVGLDCGLEAGLQFEASAFGMIAATEDRREGTRAFLEKRKPVFAGK